MFDQKGLITIEKSTIDEDTLMLAALDAGAEDIQSDEESYEITCAPNSLNGLRQALTDAGIKFESAELTMIPQTTIKIETVKEASQIIRMMDQIEDSDDVQQVHANFDIPEEILEAAAAG
jgi:transcriptional/translational regulatory protein YebC/TACO1